MGVVYLAYCGSWLLSLHVPAFYIFNTTPNPTSSSFFQNFFALVDIMAIKYKYYVEKHCANKYKLVNRFIIHGCVSSMQVYTSLVFRTASAPTQLAFVGYYGIVSVPDHHTPLGKRWSHAASFSG